MVQKALFSSASDDWETPDWLFQALNAEFGFTLDPCSTDKNAKCKIHYTKESDGLQQDWGHHVVFMNPPYGRTIEQWMKKAYEATFSGALVVCLVPARTDTRWWHQYAMKGEIRLLRGRLKFNGGPHSAPFPSAVIIFRPAGFALIHDESKTDPRTSLLFEKSSDSSQGGPESQLRLVMPD